ncbi:MAG: BamA/TamA family outer membrane protein [Luteitalea sp.]|nr:BamA/TamA family outer membrane protein [Luteitalea sp.]
MRVPIAAAVLAAIGLVVLLAVQLPLVRSSVRDTAFRWLRTQTGIVATAEELSYNLLTLDVRLRGLTAAAEESSDRPFLTASEIRIDLPWRAVLGAPAVESIELTGAIVSVLRGADGRFNLPASGGGGAPRSMPRVDVGSVVVRQADLRYQDEAAGLAVSVEGVALEMVPAEDGTIAGRLTIARGPSLRAGDLDVGGALSGSLSYDGTSLALAEVVLASDIVQIQANGRLDALWTAPSVTLGVTGALSLAGLSSMLQLAEAASGSIALTGAIEGTLAAPQSSFTLASDSVAWRHLQAHALAVEGVVNADALQIDTAAVQMVGGTVTTRGQVRFAPLRASVSAEWRELSARALAGPSAPVNVSARLSGRGMADWIVADGLSGLAVTIDVQSKADDVGGAEAVAVNGRLGLVVDKGRWRIRHDHELSHALAVEGDLEGTLSEAGVMDSSIAGQVTVSAADLSRADRLLRGAGFEIPDWSTPETGGLLMHIRPTGTLAQPHASGEASLHDLRVDRSDPFALDGSFVARREAVGLRTIRATLGENVAWGGAELNLLNGALEGAFDVALPNLSAFGATVARWRPSGELTGRVELGGTRADPTVRTTWSGASIALAGQSIGQVALDLSYAGRAAVVSRFQVEQPDGGHLRGSGSYEPDSGRHDMTLQANSLAISPIATGDDLLPLEVRIDGTLDTRGTIERLDGRGHFTLTDARWGGARLDYADAEVTLSEAGVAATLHAPAFALRGEALVELVAPYRLTVTATADNTSVRTLTEAIGSDLPPAVQDLAGTLNARVALAGPLEDPARLVVDINVASLELRSGEAALRLANPASAHYEDSTLAVENVRLQTGLTTVDVSGAIARAAGSAGLGLAIDGNLRDFSSWLALAGLPSELVMSGPVTAAFLASGSLDETTVTGQLQLDDGHVQWPGYPAASGINLRLAVEDEVIDVRELTAGWQEATVAGTARLPMEMLAEWLPDPLASGLSGAGGRASLQARLDNVTPAALAPFVGGSLDEALTGRASLQIDVNADRPTLGRLNGSLLLSALDLTAEGLPIGQDRPTRVDIVEGALQVVDWTWTVAGSRIEVEGRAQLSGAQAVDVKVGGQLDLRVISAFLPGISTSGVGELSVAVGGTLAAPFADGTVRMRNGELRLMDPQIGVSNASGLILLRPDRLELAGLEGDVNGGRFLLTGGLEYRELGITGGSILLESEGVALDVPAGMRTEVDSSISIAFANRIQVSGRVEIIRGAYREPLSLAAGLAAATRERAEASPAAGGGAPLFDHVDLNVAVASTDDLIVDNNYGRMDVGLDVRLAGTAARPSIVGRANIREGGTLFLGGRSYLIERGVIDFTDARAIVPELDLSARTRLRGPNELGEGIEYDIGVEITGTPETLKATLSSDPPRSQADIMSLLATGRLADQAGGMGGAAATEQAIGLLSGEALGFAAQAIGVDSIRIERDPAVDAFAADPAIAAEVNPAQRLTLSRRISDVAVTLSQNLRNTGLLTWIVAYSPTPTIELRTVSRDDRSRSYEMRHDVAFGGAPRTRPTRPASGDGLLRVADVRLSGDLRFPAEAIEGALKLRKGDRFDFYRWQSDRDRLRRFYLERGHLEVRISARRAERAVSDEGPSVVLEYAVEAGPQAHLEISGHGLPDKVVRELERIWSDTIIEVALIADLKEAVRRHMAREGYLRSEVDVRQISSDETEKRLHMSIARGPRSSSRRVAFAGNERLSAQELQAVVARLGIVAWLVPRNLASEIALLYREEGLLAAEVTAGPVEFTDDEAVLPVRIDEGPQFTISGVVVSGAQAQSDADVRRDSGLTPGMPYKPAVVQQARLAVSRAYDERGFNSMTSMIETVSDAGNATVEVRLTIDEGPRQVIETIAVNGARDVRPGVIAQALGLSAGAPVNMDAWYAGRRRLFRTGLFQRVDIEPVPVDDAQASEGIEAIRADVTLLRRAAWRFRYGVDVTDESAPLAEQGRVFGGGLNANLERYGLLGRPGTAGMGLRVNNDQRIARGFLTVPSFFGRAVASKLFVSRSRDLIEGASILSVVVDKTAFTAEQRFPLRRHLEMAYGYQFEQNHTFDPNRDPDDPFGFDNRVQAARLTAALVFDTRTDPFEPAAGLFHSSTVEYAPEALGSDVRFAKYSLHQFLFATVAPRVISASAVRIGIGRGFGQRLLVSEQFLAGGANTVRGYPDNALGGYDLFGDPIGGEAVIILNQELRFPIFRWLGGAGFIDAGEVFDRTTAVSLGALDVGAGGGLRFSTPVGLFRLDLATPVPGRNRPLRWHFAFGHTF